MILLNNRREPLRFTLLIRLPIAILDPENIEQDISRMNKNMIGYGKRLRNQLIKLTQQIRKNNTINGLVKK